MLLLENTPYTESTFPSLNVFTWICPSSSPVYLLIPFCYQEGFTKLKFPIKESKKLLARYFTKINKKKKWFSTPSPSHDLCIKKINCITTVTWRSAAPSWFFCSYFKCFRTDTLKRKIIFPSLLSSVLLHSLIRDSEYQILHFSHFRDHCISWHTFQCQFKFFYNKQLFLFSLTFSHCFYLFFSYVHFQCTLIYLSQVNSSSYKSLKHLTTSPLKTVGETAFVPPPFITIKLDFMFQVHKLRAFWRRDGWYLTFDLTDFELSY